MLVTLVTQTQGPHPTHRAFVQLRAELRQIDVVHGVVVFLQRRSVRVNLATLHADELPVRIQVSKISAKVEWKLKQLPHPNRHSGFGTETWACLANILTL